MAESRFASTISFEDSSSRYYEPQKLLESSSFGIWAFLSQARISEFNQQQESHNNVKFVWIGLLNNERRSPQTESNRAQNAVNGVGCHPIVQ